MAISYQELKYNQTAKEAIHSVKSKTKAYYLHLVEEFQRALPGSGSGSYGSPVQEANWRLHRRFASKLKEYDEALCKDLGIDSSPCDGQLHRDWGWSYEALKLANFGRKLESDLIKFMRNAIDNAETLDLLYSENSTHPMKRVLDLYVGIYSDNQGPNVRVIVEKLKVVSELQKILLPEKGSKMEDEKSPQSILPILKNFKEDLVKNQVLHIHRNKNWDSFVGVISFIIFLPISIYDYCHGKRDFKPLSTGKKVKDELIGIIDKVENMHPSNPK